MLSEFDEICIHFFSLFYILLWFDESKHPDSTHDASIFFLEIFQFHFDFLGLKFEPGGDKFLSFDLFVFVSLNRESGLDSGFELKDLSLYFFQIHELSIMILSSYQN